MVDSKGITSVAAGMAGAVGAKSVVAGGGSGLAEATDGGSATACGNSELGGCGGGGTAPYGAMLPSSGGRTVTISVTAGSGEAAMQAQGCRGQGTGTGTGAEWNCAVSPGAAAKIVRGSRIGAVSGGRSLAWSGSGPGGTRTKGSTAEAAGAANAGSGRVGGETGTPRGLEVWRLEWWRCCRREQAHGGWSRGWWCGQRRWGGGGRGRRSGDRRGSCDRVGRSQKCRDRVG